MRFYSESRNILCYGVHRESSTSNDFAFRRLYCKQLSVPSKAKLYRFFCEANFIGGCNHDVDSKFFISDLFIIQCRAFIVFIEQKYRKNKKCIRVIRILSFCD